MGQAAGQVTAGRAAGQGVPKLAVWAGRGPSYCRAGCRPGCAKISGVGWSRAKFLRGGLQARVCQN